MANKYVKEINDLKRFDADSLERCKLAAAYRMVDLRGWSENIYNHITVM
jgi:ribulose-5-phosphate 4-epimerase/fuculose-1-phosphate aldolase